MPTESARFSVKAEALLNDWVSHLDEMDSSLVKVIKAGGSVDDVPDVFKAIASASDECRTTLEYYDDDDALPLDVKIAIEEVQRAIRDCVNSLLAYATVKKFA